MTKRSRESRQAKFRNNPLGPMPQGRHTEGRSLLRELIEGRGCELLYLPAYSPDLNPIEEAFAKLKALLRKAGARTREALLEAMGRALDAVRASDARSFFEHRGYRPLAQPL